MKEIEVSMVLTVPAVMSEDTINDMFLAWVESNGWTTGGMIKDITEQKTK